jgi:hypothetical protein
MTAGRKVLASLAIALGATLFPLSSAFAGDLQTCILGDEDCITVDAPDEVVEVVGGSTDAATDAVGGVKNGTDKATGGWSDPVTSPVVDGITETLDLTPSTDEGGKGKHKKKNKNRAERPATTGPVITEQAAAIASFQRSMEEAAGVDPRAAIDGEINHAASFVPPDLPSLSERLAQAAAEAAKAFAFPAVLIAMVVGFVLVQNRIDHKDPKLAFAPISSDQEYLSFT